MKLRSGSSTLFALTLVARSLQAQAEAAPLPPVQVRLELSTSYARVLVWESLPMTLILTNVGAGDAPFGRELLAGCSGEATLVLVVDGAGGEPGPPDEFFLDPSVNIPCCCPTTGGGLLRAGQETRTPFDLCGKSSSTLVAPGQVTPVFEPAFPRAGRYELRACYRCRGQVFFSNPMFIEAFEPVGQARLAMEYLETLGADTVGLYYPRFLPSFEGEREARLLHLAEDFGVNVYSDNARYALACHSAPWAFEPALGATSDAHAKRMRAMLGGIGSPDFKRIEEAQRLSTHLDEFERELARSKRH